MKYHNIPTLFDNQASLINGKNIGTDSVRYIQDAGQKTAGTTYIDRNTNELYVCVTTTNSVNNDSNFSKFNLKEAFNKLDRCKVKWEITLLGSIWALDKRLQSYTGPAYKPIYSESYYKQRRLEDYDFIYIVGSDGYPVGQDSINDTNFLYSLGDIGQSIITPNFPKRNPIWIRVENMSTNEILKMPILITLYESTFSVVSINGVDYTKYHDNSDGVIICGVNQILKA